ncbi:MAG: DUF4249 family protein [Bacteroidales bacterium]|nr:DUF4249 family protein [Bacteroidales bacterium]
MKKRILLLLCVLAAASCEIPFSLENVSEPAIYVQYIPSSEMAADIMVAYAEPAFGKPGNVQYDFHASDVTVEVNGKKVDVGLAPDDTLWNAHTLRLRNPQPFKSGDQVSVSVAGRGVPDVHASTVVPERPAIKDIQFQSVTRDSSDAWKITVRLDKPVREGERYGIKAFTRQTWITAYGPDMFHLQIDTSVSVSTFTPGQIASTADLNSLDLDAFASVSYQDGFINTGWYQNESITLLTDRQFNGDSYTFYANAESLMWEEFESGFDWDALLDSGYGGYDDFPDDYYYEDDPEYEDEEPESIWLVLGDTVEYRFEMYRLSDEFYNYAKAQYLMMFDMLSNFGVSPPNFTYSNVAGGLGVVAAVSGSSSDWMTPVWKP